MGRVCAKHNEFYETECRWCEPKPAVDTALHFTFAENVNTVATASAFGGWYSWYDVIPIDNRGATGAVPAVQQANGWVLPAMPAPPRDPSVREDLCAAWDALEAAKK